MAQWHKQKFLQQLDDFMAWRQLTQCPTTKHFRIGLRIWWCSLEVSVLAQTLDNAMDKSYKWWDDRKSYHADK